MYEVPLLQDLLRLIFPARCHQCGLWGAGGLCSSCWQQQREGLHRLEGFPIVAAGHYEGGLRRAVLALKASGDAELAANLAARLSRLARRHLRPATLVPIPASPSRARWRGHRPVEILARELSRALGWPLQTQLLTLLGDPRPRKFMDARERQLFALAFSVRHAPPPRIVLVDDVLTTGETLGRAAAALEAAGCSHLAGLVVARTPARDLPRVAKSA